MHLVSFLFVQTISPRSIKSKKIENVSNITSLYQCQLYQICWQYTDVATSLMTLQNIHSINQIHFNLQIVPLNKMIVPMSYTNLKLKKTCSMLSYYITSIIMNDNANHNLRCHMVVNSKIDVQQFEEQNEIQTKISVQLRKKYILITEEVYFDVL